MTPAEEERHGGANAGAPSPTASSPGASRDGAAAPAPFLNKTYDMIDDASSDQIVSWGSEGTSFVVWNPPEFARDLLPQFFKHSNFSSFVRQLNTYGFRKIDPDRWEFANEEFVRGDRSLLKNISRKKPSLQQLHQQQQQQQQQQNEPSRLGLEAEIEKLKRDKNVLMLELVRLRQQQQQTERELSLMGQRVQGSEQRQKHMIAFLAKAIQSPVFLDQVLRREARSSSSCCELPAIAGPRKRKLLTGAIQHQQQQQQLVKYDPVDKLNEFFNAPDLASKKLRESELELELLIRELLRQQEGGESSSEEDDDAADDVVTVVETNKDDGDCQASTKAASVTTPCSDITSAEDLASSALEGQSSETRTVKRSRTSFNLNSEPEDADTGKAETGARLEGEIRASVDNGAVGVGFNDVFWERFLTDSEAQQQ